MFDEFSPSFQARAFTVLVNVLEAIDADTAAERELELRQRVQDFGGEAVCDELTAECNELLAAAEADYLTPGERADVRLMFAIVRGAVRFMSLVLLCDRVADENAGETCLVLAV